MEDGIPGGLQHRHKTCCEKGGRCGRQACRVQRWHHRGDVVFRTGGLAYDSLAENIGKFVILGRDIREIRSFCKFCEVGLNVQGTKTEFEIMGAWKF